MPVTSRSRIASKLRFALAIAGRDFALDVDHLVHRLDRLVGDLGQNVDIALVAAQAARRGGRGVMRALGGEQGDLPGGFVELFRFLGRVLISTCTTACDATAISRGMTTSMPLEIFIMRVSAAFLFWPMIGNEQRRADQVLPHFRDLAAEIGDRAAEFQNFGGIGRIAGLHGVLAQALQFLLAAIERDLTGGDFDLQSVKALADGQGLLVEQFDR